MKTKNNFPLAATVLVLLLNSFTMNAQWSAVHFDQHNIFQKLSAVTANTVFVIGVEPVNHQNFILRTNDGGTNWDSISFNTANDTFLLRDIFFVDANTGFTGGSRNGIQVLMKTTDNGNSWTEITPDTSAAGLILSLYFVNSQTGFAGSGTSFYKTLDQGTTWTSMPVPFFIRGLFFEDGNNGFSCGDSAVAIVKQTADAGQSWNTVLTAMDPNLFVSSFAKLDFINPNTGFTVMDNTNKLYRTLDGGNSWQTIIVDSVDVIRDFDFISQDTGHVLAEVAWAQEFRILLTVDGGQSWTMEYTTGWNFYGGGVILNSCSFVEQTGYVTGTNGLVKRYFPSAAGINEEEFEGTTSLFPNPISVSGTLQITNWHELKTKYAELKIYDAFGREVFRSEISGPEVELNRDNMPEGIYLYRINSGNEILATGKLVVAD